MQAHVGEAGVQMEGCGALANICGGEDAGVAAIAQAAADAGALVAIVAAMRAHEDDEAVIDEGRSALYHICWGSDARRAAALQAGAEEGWLD